MHYACRVGCSGFLKLFLNHGSSINVKNNSQQSPLHIAAKYGSYTSCLAILQSENQKSILNEKDKSGLLKKFEDAFYISFE